MNKIKKRNPYVAGLFAFLAFPLGYLYVGHIKRGSVMLTVFIFTVAIISLTRVIQYNYGIWIAVAIVLTFLIYTIVDSVLLSKNNHTYALKPYNRWYYYVLIYVCFGITQSYTIENRGKYLGYETYRIPSTSMEPTIQVGDFIIVNTWKEQIERGDVVVFRYPKDLSIDYIFRVIGLPNEEITYRDKVVLINGRPLQQTHLEAYISYARPSIEFQEKFEQQKSRKYKIIFDENRPIINGRFAVPEGHYFVMGDNRDNSNDSRYWGFVPEEDIKGAANYIWMSYDSNRGIIEDRVGMAIQ